MAEEQQTQERESETPTHEPAQGRSEFDPRVFADKVEARLADMGKQLGRIHEWRKSLAGEPEGESAKPSPDARHGLTAEDLDAAIAFGEKRARLPEAARAKLDAMREAGKSYREVAEMADLLAEFAKSSEGAKPSESRTRDNPASGPRQTNGPSVRTYREYQDLAARALYKGDADAKRIIDALNADPDFSPSHLPLK